MSANLKKILSREKMVYVSERAFHPKGTIFSRNRDSFSVSYSFKGVLKGKRGFERRKEIFEDYRKKICKIAEDLGLDILLGVNYDVMSIGFHPK